MYTDSEQEFDRKSTIILYNCLFSVFYIVIMLSFSVEWTNTIEEQINFITIGTIIYCSIQTFFIIWFRFFLSK